MAQKSEEHLLAKKYYANCPGCKADQINNSRSGLPIPELLSISAIVLCTALPVSSLFPFLYFMIRDFGVAKREEDIGYYAGYVGSSFMVGRALTSVLWGVVADHYGRKPVIIMGTMAVVTFNTLFGLSVNFGMAIITRFLLGSFNGLLGPIKAYAVEILREEHQAFGLSTVSAAWAVGLIIGPALGGFLAQPAEKYPNIFSKESLFGRFPYFLPCLCISLSAFVVTIASCWLPETLHMHNESDILLDDSFTELEPASIGCNVNGEALENEERKLISRGSIMKNWPLMSSILVYCIFSLHDMAYTEVSWAWGLEWEMNSHHGPGSEALH